MNARNGTTRVGFTAAFAWLSRRRAGVVPEPRGLIECRWCRTDNVCAIDWEETDETHWWIRLRCGECGTWRDVVSTDDEAAALDRELAAQTATIELALVRIDRERMAADLDVLVSALQYDLIDPSSF